MKHIAGLVVDNGVTDGAYLLLLSSFFCRTLLLNLDHNISYMLPLQLQLQHQRIAIFVKPQLWRGSDEIYWSCCTIVRFPNHPLGYDLSLKSNTKPVQFQDNQVRHINILMSFYPHEGTLEMCIACCYQGLWNALRERQLLTETWVLWTRRSWTEI